MTRLYRITTYHIRRMLREMLRSKDSPRQIAGGVAIGVQIGFMPTMGGQMITAALLATLFGCSRIPAMAMVYITNPFTAIPIYGTCYLVGVAILRPFGFQPVGLDRLTALLTAHVEGGPWRMIYVKLAQLFSLGIDTLAPLWLGCILCGAVAAVCFYHLSLRFVTGHRLIKAEKMMRRAQKRLERIRRRQERERRKNEQSENAQQKDAHADAEE